MGPTPYVWFGGTAADAFTRYAEIFGGELNLMRFGDMPSDDIPDDDPMAGANPEHVLHAELRSDDFALMGSDDPTGPVEGPVQRVALSVDVATLDAAHRVFDQLAEGGTAIQPLMETFFSPGWGVVDDRFGVRWMVSVPGTGMPPA